MIIEPTHDIDLIESVLKHPEIFPLIKGAAPDDFTPPLSGVMYLAGFNKGLVGVACYHPFRDGLKYHPNVLPEQRRYANKFIRRTIEMVIVPLYVEVPKRLERLCHYHGFEEIERGEKILMAHKRNRKR